ncbi:MAG: hypothetical protein A2017_02230 [Lentisphaerae bacterium GWF2_44_16]|nr:MAG: hypothetical protein A2017_02230 [Lentisphaerae bacterium GWF2_44_16]
MLKKLLPYIFSIIICNTIFAQSLTPPLPVKESTEGYLNTSAKEIQLTPSVKNFFITQQSELPVYEDTPSYIVVLYEKDDGSLLFKIPKVIRYVSLMLMTDNSKKVLFRGAMEADTIPIKISAGEELPVDRILDDGYIVFLKRNNLLFKVYVSKSETGISFSKKNRFDKYAEEQKKKNLYYYKGEWISKEKLDEIKKEAELQEAKRKDKLKNVKAAAEEGYMVLKNSEILEGRFNGIAKDQILFNAGGFERWIKLDETADGMNTAQIVSIGKIFSAGKMLEKANALYVNNELGQAMRFATKCNNLLKEIQDNSNPDLKAKLKAAENLSDKIMKTLKAENKSLYNYQVFKTDELNYHLNEKHILFRNSIWLKPEQLCIRCNGSGLIDCPVCNGLGYISKHCPNCKNGFVQCTICEGRGWRSCPQCNGNGYIMKKCGKCNGSGYVSVTSLGGYYRPYRPVVSPGVIATSGGIVVNIPPTCYYPSYYYNDFSYRRVKCDICGGTGQMQVTCPKCNGSGRLPCPKVQICPVCGGKTIINSVCNECHGKKKISCPDCEGKGYHGKAQQFPPTQKNNVENQPPGKGTEKMSVP